MKNGQQGSWLGGAKAGDANNVRTSDVVLQHATAPPVSEPRPGSVSPSINFSYPRARHESPAPSNASASEVVMVYDANSRRMVPKVQKVELMERQESVRAASEKPVKKKKQPVARSGSHLAKGTVDRTIVAPAESLQAVAPATEAAQTPSQPKPEASEAQPAVTHRAPPPAAEPIPEPQEQPPVDDTDKIPLAADPTPERKETVPNIPAVVMPEPEPAPVLHKKPSTVLEEPEAEERADIKESISTKDYAAIDAVPVRSSQPLASPEPEPSHSHLEPTPTRDSVRRVRVHSESPARSPGRAHFAAAAATDQLVVRHEPPPRSLSPRKSALKQSSSVRGASPSDDSSEASGPFSREDSAARKKAVRVSFNEEHNVVLGESAEPQENESPVVLSPQAKHKPWRSFMNRNKKESNSYDEEETMSPRPALPLFGSVREKKAKEPDNERPLVRPSERAYSPAQASTSPGTSTDSAIGSILAQESATRNEANTSRTREPLPPVVQSIEGNGYLSSSSNDSSDEELDDADTQQSSQTVQSTPSIGTAMTSQVETPQMEDAPEFVETQVSDKVILTSPKFEAPPSDVKDSDTLLATPSFSSASKSDEMTEKKDEHIPSISVQAATPPNRSHVPESPDKEYFDVPGGFPVDMHGHSTSSGEESTKAVGKSVEPVLATPDSAGPPSPTRVMGDIAEEEESDHSSIYSDAYEDLSDVGADGFMSLDAVLDAAPKSQVSRLYEKTVNESKAHASADGTAALSSGAYEAPPKTVDDWENAKSYWRSLTVDKRRQLEKEAIEEAGEEADQEAISKPKKTKKRRSVDRPPSILKTSESAPNPERVYQIQPGSSWTPEESQTHSRDSSPPAAQAAPAKGFRKSMRAEQPPRLDTTQQGNGSLRKTMRSNGSAGDVNASASARTTTTARPASYHVGAPAEPPRTNRRTLSSEGRPASSGFAGAAMKPTLRRRGSDSSESSFKRSRSNSEGIGFRRTMRTHSQEPESPRAAAGSGRFSIRSLSPTGSAFRRSAPPSAAPTMGLSGGRMRTSLRAAPAEKDKSRFSTFGRSSGKKAKKGLSGGSRFADSSDEDDGRPALFSTRFADSSDEDSALPSPSRNGGLSAKTMRSSQGPAPAAAGSLRVGRQVRSDSPDLPDSDDEAPAARPDGFANGHARPELQRSRSGRGSLNAVSPAVLSTQGVGERPAHQRRGSFMSSILRRKKDTGGKISRDIGESAARRDTRLERSTEELAVIRSNSGGHPRLQKRGPSWPLADEAGDSSRAAPASPITEPQRPATSSGGPSATSPRGFLKRRSLSAQQVPPVPPIPAIPKSQVVDMPPERSQMTDVPPDATLKKKKFGTLRKIFGLND